MTLDFLNEYYIPVVVALCLIIGFCIKEIKAIPDKYIPTILAVIGAICGCISMGCISLQAIVCGAFSGLSSTGLHQLFKQLLTNGGNEWDYRE